MDCHCFFVGLLNIRLLFGIFEDVAFKVAMVSSLGVGLAPFGVQNLN